MKYDKNVTTEHLVVLPYHIFLSAEEVCSSHFNINDID